jgi:VWFA-related protein
MGTCTIFKKSCVVLSVLLFIACSGGGGDSAPQTPTPNISLQSSLILPGTILDNSVDETFSIRNTGNADLTIGQILPLNLPFSIVTDTCTNATLAPSRTCSLRIRFSPTIQGPSNETLSIPSNDPDSSTANIGLSGEGYGLSVWINKVTTNCPTVSVDVTVTDPDSTSLIGSLTKDDFKLYQNGQLQDITASAIQFPSPVSLVLTLDWSVSTQPIISDVQAAANAFVSQSQAIDRVAICKFAKGLDFYPPDGSVDLFIVGDAAGKASLNTYINTTSVPFLIGDTAFYDAVFYSIDRAAQGITEKRAVIVLSDGEDTYSVKTLNQVIANASGKGIPVFTIFYVDPSRSDVYMAPFRQIMQRLASETGGQFYISTAADLTLIFQQISNVLSNKYTLTYTSTTCSGTISVRADSGDLYGVDSTTFP